ncbi:MAG: hypothetical protein ACREBC_09365 [Pyrinomonadaceae bacterium]
MRAEFDPAQSLRGAIVTPRTKHHTSLTAKDLPSFLDAVDAYSGRLSTKIAAKLLLLTFVRKSELLEATWEETPMIMSLPSDRRKRIALGCGRGSFNHRGAGAAVVHLAPGND